LQQLYEDDDVRGLPSACLDKLWKILAFLEAMEDAREFRSVPVWRAHRMSGDRKGTWSLHVTRNWRLTFWIDEDEKEICDVNFEDYH
jgi:toxin HigB-1